LLFHSEFFVICQLRHAHVRKDVRLSPLSVLQAMKSWAGPGNEASKVHVWKW